jgi:hypothetical protein
MVAAMNFGAERQKRRLRALRDLLTHLPSAHSQRLDEQLKAEAGAVEMKQVRPAGTDRRTFAGRAAS